MRNFDYTILEMIENAIRNSHVRPMYLGGVATSGGGGGGPPGGFIGYLPQRRVTYDFLEDETMYTPPSGYSLYDNLNHIRYRIGVLETYVGTVLSPVYSEDLTSQIGASGTVFTTDSVIASGSLRLYYNGLRQRPTYYNIGIDDQTITTDFVAYSGDSLLVDYDTPS